MAANDYDGGAYRDYLGSYVGNYTTAEAVLSGRSAGQVEDISQATANDGTREFIRYEWNAAGTVYSEIWHHYSDWYKDFNVSGQDIQSIYDTYVPTTDEQAASLLEDIWSVPYAGTYTDAETLVKTLGTVEEIPGGIKTLVAYEWDGGLYHELWHHESDEYRHYADALPRTSNYDRVAWVDATETRAWDQVLTGSHDQDQGYYEDGGNWNEIANVGANRTNPVGEGNNDSWIQALNWVANGVHIDEFEDRYHMNVNVTYNWHDVWDARENYDYAVTYSLFGSEAVIAKTSESAIADGTAKLFTHSLIITAGHDVKVTTAVDTAIVDVTDEGRIYLIEDDGVTLTRVSNNDGTIDIEAGGTIDAVLIESTTDADANDITITTTQGDIHATMIDAGTAGDVNLAAAGAITATVTADVLVAQAGEAITLMTTVASLDAETTGSGDIVITETDNIDLIRVLTANGSITVTAGGDITAAQIVTGSSDSLSLNAAGTVTATVTADALVVLAGGPITLITTVTSLDAQITGTGDIMVTETDSIHLIRVLTADGSITVTAGGDIIATQIDAGTAGNVNLDAAGEITATVTADGLVVLADGPITLVTTVASLDAETTGTGDITVTETDRIHLIRVLTADGSIIITAGGDIIATQVQAGTAGDANLEAAGAITATVTADGLVVLAGGPITLITTVANLDAATTGTGDITVTETNSLHLIRVLTADGSITVIAGGDIIATQIDAGTAGNVNLEAAGEITATVTADGLVVLAGGPITLVTTVVSLEAEITGTGDITVTETDGLRLIRVLTADGSIMATAGGDIVATQIEAGTAGDVNLEAAGAITATVIADALVALAGGSITLMTTATSLDAETTGEGTIMVTETDSIDLIKVLTADGSITIIADGTITATRVESLTDETDNRITLTATGDILIDLIKAGKIAGGVFLISGGDIHEVDVFDLDVDLSARSAHIEVAGEFGSSTNPDLALELDLGTLAFYGHSLILNHQGDIELRVEATGIIDITATGSVFVTSVTSGANAITMSVGGDIHIDYMDAGAAAGVVVLTAGGSILEVAPADSAVDLIARDAILLAGLNIGGATHRDLDLESELETISAVTGSSVGLNEQDDVDVAMLNAVDGSIFLTAGGTIHLVGDVNAGENIFLVAGLEIYMESGYLLSTGKLDTTAGSGIFLHTRVVELDARIDGAGILEIHETDGIILNAVTNANGAIRVVSGGPITALYVASETDASGNNVGLMSLSGDIAVDYVGVGAEFGQISLSSADDIFEVNDDSEIDLSGALGILYAQDWIDKYIETAFSPRPGHGHKASLYKFDHGKKLDIGDLKGNVELFFTVDDKVHVVSDGDISVTYLATNGHDVDLRSKYGDIYVEYLDAGPDKGDVKLEAFGSVVLAGQSYGGDKGQITAGDHVQIKAHTGDIELWGSVEAGTGWTSTHHHHHHHAGIRIDAGSNVSIFGAVTSMDDVELQADGSIYVDAAITVLDDLKVEAKGDLTITANADLVAGDDVRLESLADVLMSGKITAGDDVEVSTILDIEIGGTIEAADHIRLSAEDDLTLSLQSYLTGIDGIAAKHVHLYAGDVMVLDGAINAEKTIIH